ncbi:TSUP family transporter [Streptomyces coeruleorubidus]|uniref:Probable membrane transporter protein n=1 Tax=Streptomyces coeruleorubidus TaxID=116188 RepID=A0ABZ0KQE9_STRC4|nr:MULTISPECIES: TSUP family transporter [Streptomyces]WOT40300.1 TSUP family transporter [Streptomyces coeruleorubidus]
MLIATALLIAFFFLGSVCLKHVRDFSPLRTGLVFLPVAVATGIGAHLGARLVGRIGSRPTAVAGMAVAAAGSVPPTRLSESGSVDAGLLPDFVIASLGIGAVFVTATTTALAMVEHREAGLASGVVNTFHEVGGSIDVAVVSTVAASGLERGSAGGFAGAFNSIPEVRGAVGDPRCPSPRGACSGGQGGAPARMPGMTTAQNLAPRRSTRSVPVVVGVGVAIGVLGGMIGLGGAEFRLPLLVGLFGFAALSAVILNKAMSLVVILVALPARLAVVPATEVVARWPVAVNLLAGSLLGAWAGATWAVRMRSATLHKVLGALMLLMAAALMVTHTTTLGTLALPLWAQVPCGVVAGFGVGVVAAIMGVAGGELLIPTIVLLFGVDIKTAGSLSLLVSLPTMLVAFARYSRDGSFAVIGANLRFTLVMATGSVAGALMGGLLLGVFPDLVLIPALTVILLVSAAKLARHH